MNFFSIEMEQTVFATLQDDISRGFLIRHPIEDQALDGALTLLTLLSAHPLRTLDALHLSTARRHGAKQLVTADRIMIGAAQAIGFDVVPFD